jgi:hypothetical protein
MSEWKIVVKDRYPVYLDWDGFERVQAMLRDNESAPFRGLASPTDFFDCQAALPFLRARSSVEMLTPDCSAACW